jgi:TonB family protein
MSPMQYNVWRPQNVALVVAVTVLINALIFAALPWLNRVADREQDRERVIPYLLTPRRPPKTTELEKEKRLRIEELKLAPKPKSQSRTAKRQSNKPEFGFEFSKGGFGNGIAVAVIKPEEFGLHMEEFGFDVTQVDKAPRAIRRVPAVYPFSAKRRGIRAKVKIRCLVDKSGMPQRIVAAECDPEDVLEVFGPPAVAAVKKWRFSPGEIGGDPVPTRVAFRIIFELES